MHIPLSTFYHRRYITNVSSAIFHHQRLFTLRSYGGCFWHGHADCGGFRLPKTNVAFWQRKIERNKERDREEQRKLAQMGWHCITVWECELKTARRQQTLEALAHTLNHIFLQDHSRPKGPTHYRLREEEEMTGMAAEPEQRGSEQPNNGGNK